MPLVGSANWTFLLTLMAKVRLNWSTTPICTEKLALTVAHFALFMCPVAFAAKSNIARTKVSAYAHSSSENFQLFLNSYIGTGIFGKAGIGDRNAVIERKNAWSRNAGISEDTKIMD